MHYVSKIYVLINFNLENDLSVVATVTGNVRNRTKAVYRSWNVGSRD